MRHETTKQLPERFGPAVSVNIILRKGDSVLLLRRANTGWADGYYTLPAGHLEGDEPLTQAAAREVHEEVGVIVESNNLRLVHVMHRSNREDDRERLDFYFMTEQWRGEPWLAEPEKSDDLGWYRASELPERTLENVTRALGQYATQMLSEVNW